MNFLYEPWPWYVAGPLIGITLFLLLWVSNKNLGISSSFRHVCAACVPANISFLKYDWKAEKWNLIFVLGVFLGGVIAWNVIGHPELIAISDATIRDIQKLGISHESGLLPSSLISFESFITWQGFLFMAIGGFFVGFGTRYAGGCTSGHAITGLSHLQWASLLAVVGFFAGGLVMTHLIFPLIF
ncbi:MAG: YeeE/YedE family protein [Chitinophagaceae bacterium]|nr:MAG: YeeE/YedE family protein [Chitinophagaceae bacterium]